MDRVVNGRFLTQPTTGVQRYAGAIAESLTTLDPSIVVVSPRKLTAESNATTLHPRKVGLFGGYAWEQLELPMFLRCRRRRPILLSLANMAPLSYDRNVVTIHDVAFLRHPEWYSRAFRLTYRFFIPRIARLALKVITDSEFSRREILELLGVPESRIEVIPCAATPASGGETVSGANPYGRYVLGVSSLAPSKNLKGLVESFRLLADSDLKLVVVGKRHRAFGAIGIDTESPGAESIVFTGHVSDRELATLYHHAEVFVYPSFYEGFGMPPLEAMTAGCPVVVSNAASLPEVCGDAAVYVDPARPGEIADAIRNVLSDRALREDLIARGKAQAERFDWPTSAGAVLDVLSRL